MEYAVLHFTHHSDNGNNTILNMMDRKQEPILVNACTYFMQSKLEFCALVLFIYDWPYTTYKSSTRTRIMSKTGPIYSKSVPIHC